MFFKKKLMHKFKIATSYPKWKWYLITFRGPQVNYYQVENCCSTDTVFLQIIKGHYCRYFTQNKIVKTKLYISKITKGQSSRTIRIFSIIQEININYKILTKEFLMENNAWKQQLKRTWHGTLLELWGSHKILKTN